MSDHATRRRFIQQGAAASALAACGDLGFLSALAPVSASEARLDKRAVELSSDMAPLVRMLEETPRDRLLEEMAVRIRSGLSYRDLLAALLLAGVKNVEPRPSVGHKFHAVLVVNSAHLASLSSPPEHRWLPIFWALDYYKSSEARDVEERGDWTMPPVNAAHIPGSLAAPQAFDDAMEAWDESAADAAIVGLARSAGANAIYETLFRYGARDFRSIGHKAIYVANSYRTLQCIGWRHAEPVLRSLVYALLMHEGKNPRDRDAAADRPFRQNLERQQQIRADWQVGEINASATEDLVTALRGQSADEACDHVVELVNRGVAPQSIWDGLHSAAAELLMRQPGIVALHAVTSTNAMHYGFRTAADDETRRLILLQNAAFLPLFREAMHDRGEVADRKIQQLVPGESAGSAQDSIAEIFASVSQDPGAAANKVLGYLSAHGNVQSLVDAARLLVFTKGDDAHDYKYSSAVLEDYLHVSPRWRDRYLAASVYKLRGTQDRDNPLVARTRAALAG
jgi:hypothetical protein